MGTATPSPALPPQSGTLRSPEGGRGSSPPPSGGGGRGGVLELLLLLAAALYSLGYLATLGGRLPSDADYQAAADAIRAGWAEGDAVAPAPEWASAIRLFAHGYSYLGAPDLATADLSDVKRLWLLGLPTLPRSSYERTRAALASKLQADGPEQHFGVLVLQRYTNPGFRVPLYDFTGSLEKAQVSVQLGAQRAECPLSGEAHRCRGAVVQAEWREIEFAPYRCVGANAVGRPELVVEYPEAALGKRLEVLAGVTGEMGWKHSPEYTPVKLTVDVDGQRVGEIVVHPGTVPPIREGYDTSRFDPNAPHRVRFAVTSDNPKEREFCFDARAY